MNKALGEKPLRRIKARREATLLKEQPQSEVVLNENPQQSGSGADVHKKIRRLELISELFEICNSTSNLNELMNRVFSKVVQDVKAEAGSLWLNDEVTEENTCYVAEGPTKDKVIGLKLPKGTGVIGYVIEHAECQTVFDAANDPRFSTSVDKKTGFKTRSMICAPLMVEGHAVGAVQLINHKSKDGKFNGDDLSLLRILCQSSATPIVNARLSASQQKVQELSTLLEISKEISSNLDLDSCMLSVVNLCSKLIPYDRAAIGLIDKKGIKVAAISGQTDVQQSHPDVVHLIRLMEMVNKSGEDLYVVSGKKYQKSQDPDPVVVDYLKRYHQGSLAIYRLFDEESELGFFLMESKKENLVPDSMSDRIEILKNMLTVTLRNAQLYNSVPRLSLFGQSGNKGMSWKKTLFISGMVGLFLFAASFIPSWQKAVGSVEVLPHENFLLFAGVDGVVERTALLHSDSVFKGDTLVWFKTDFLQEDYFRQKNQILILQQKLRNLQQSADYNQMHITKLELEKAQIQLGATQRKLNASKLVAPVNGLLTDDKIRHLSGRKFSRGDELFEIVEMGNYTVKLMIEENDIQRIRKGQPVQFRVPAFPQTTFEGNVKQITFETEVKSNVTYYPLLVTLTGNVAQLLPGMTGRGKITVYKTSLLMKLIDKPKNYLIEKFWL